jgi:dTDP-4-dehydrorhamnose 3,5-epimerase
MKNYKYSAKNPEGRTVSGTLNAPGKDEVVGELRKRNLTILEVQEVRTEKGNVTQKLVRPGKPRKQDELVVFARQLATMVSAGITLLESIEILCEQAESAPFRATLRMVADDIRTGSDLSRSTRGVLRGLHFTKSKPQAQIVTVMRGRIFDVVVDIRKDSPTFGKWFGTELSDEGPRQVYMAHGFAHGFCVLSDYADLHYKVSHRYDPNDEGGLIWNDDEVKIDWPIKNPLISDRDMGHRKLEEL